MGQNYSKMFSAAFDEHKDSDANEGEKSNKEITNNKEDASVETFEGEGAEVLEDEIRGSGSHLHLYWKYFRAGNNYLFIATVAILCVLGQISINALDYWQSFWTSNNAVVINLRRLNLSESYNQDISDIDIHEKVGPFTTVQYVYIYSIILLICIAFNVLRGFLYYKMCMKSSEQLHNEMFNCIIRTVLRFFDKNPAGRILNRFSKDTGQIDEMLPVTMLDAIGIYLTQLGSIVLVAMTLPWTVAAAVVLFIIVFYMSKIYLNTAQAIKRIESVTKSPVFSQIYTTLNGITTIRSNNAQNKCIKEFDEYQDVHTSTCNQIIYASSSFSWWIDTTCSIYVFVIIFVILIFKDGIGAGFIGVSISSAMTISSILQYGVMLMTDVIALMTNVERVVQYTKLRTEKNLHEGEQPKPANWPHQGAIQFKGLSLRYDEDKPLILQDLNVYIEPGWKVGIVGRTGAGKTSLTTALFRLANVEGEILIDGLDTGCLSLQGLRSSISIIPQEPVLFSASVRYNLDPFNEHDDFTLWNALESVELKEAIPSLEFKISQGGSNFSVGQRQLICLARAIIKDNKILVMDEATANVDPRTDGFIQDTIRNKFARCTVLTIAHRLNTIMDSDRVLVMHYGKVVEFDHPYVLLMNPEGFLTKMVNETGLKMAAQLYKVAEETLRVKE